MYEPKVKQVFIIKIVIQCWWHFRYGHQVTTGLLLIRSSSHKENLFLAGTIANSLDCGFYKYWELLTKSKTNSVFMAIHI